MKISFCSILIGASVLVVPQLASATLLVGYANFVSGGGDPNIAALSGSATESAVGVTGTYSGGGNLLLGSGLANPWWSDSGNYGADPAYPITSDTSTSLGTNGWLPVVFTVNASAGAYVLDTLIFEQTTGHSGGTSYVISYVTSNPAYFGTLATLTTTNSGNAAPASNNWEGEVVSLADITGVFGVDFDSIAFTISSPEGGIDNLALTAIPEPGSLLALGCLLGSGAFLHNRRRGVRLKVA
ncbi:MAG: PEP-CTERM sorting domain-containing protein [Verrucomicrobia bacterium]|nr:PEP-CTERM sorting domain-containing protein [Verrucomicrobiota bacterium]